MANTSRTGFYPVKHISAPYNGQANIYERLPADHSGICWGLSEVI